MKLQQTSHGHVSLNTTSKDIWIVWALNSPMFILRQTWLETNIAYRETTLLLPLCKSLWCSANYLLQKVRWHCVCINIVSWLSVLRFSHRKCHSPPPQTLQLRCVLKWNVIMNSVTRRPAVFWSSCLSQRLIHTLATLFFLWHLLWNGWRCLIQSVKTWHFHTFDVAD